MKGRRMRGSVGSATVCTNLLGMDVVIEFDYEITCEAIPQSYDEPSSPMEYETFFTGLYEDKPGIEHKPKDYLETPAWLVTLLDEYLSESDRVYDEIVKDISEY